MNNVLKFPLDPPEDFDGEAYFERFPDPALLLRCFEVLDGVLEVVCDPERSIQMEDDTHAELIEALWAIKVLFKRKTGHDAKRVDQDYREAMSRHLLENGPAPDMRIPIVAAGSAPLPLEAFEGLSTQALACAGLNYADRVSEAIMNHSPQALAMADARVSAIDATTALRVLVLRLSGGSLETMVMRISRQPGETLQ